jgi:hypothetical protein
MRWSRVDAVERLAAATRAVPRRYLTASLPRMKARSSIAGLTCAICATRDAMTLDHIPPRSIFPRPRPSDLITVPACGECNGGSSPNDEEFKVGLSLLAGVDSPETRALWDQGAMRTLAHNKRLHREIMSRLVKVDVQTPAGIYLGTERAVLVPKRAIHAVLVRTIRGLFYHHFGEPLGERARCDVRRFEGKGDLGEVAKIVKNLPTNKIANGALRYRYGRAGDAPLSSIWLMSFFGTVQVFGYTMAVEDDWQPDNTPA